MQQHFGLIEIPADTFLTKSYPVALRWTDLPAVAGAVVLVTACVTQCTVRSMLPNETSHAHETHPLSPAGAERRGTCSRPASSPTSSWPPFFPATPTSPTPYVSREQIDTDSLKLYEPVFDRYGYGEDVYYTIGNFSRRKKSARLSDVVGARHRYCSTPRAHARPRSRRAGHDRPCGPPHRHAHAAHTTLLRVERLRDTSLLHFALDSIRPGDYRVTFRYRIDSLDRNTSWRGDVWLGTSRPPRVRSASTTRCAAAAATRTTSARSPRAARTGA